MKRYYFYIKFLLPDSDPKLLAGRCISMLHGFINKHQLNGIGVSFPQWSAKNLGQSIAFVSQNQEHIIKLREQSYFKFMKNEGFFELSEVQLVPIDLSEVSFVRNQSVAKLFVGEKRRRLKRAKRRAKERGEEFAPDSTTNSNEFRNFHRVKAISKSKGQSFILHIQKRELVDEVCLEYNGYGFATNKEINGSVPQISLAQLELE
jgi:CRISPR-associated endonuclease Csy4